MASHLEMLKILVSVNQSSYAAFRGMYEMLRAEGCWAGWTVWAGWVGSLGRLGGWKSAIEQMVAEVNPPYLERESAQEMALRSPTKHGVHYAENYLLTYV